MRVAEVMNTWHIGHAGGFAGRAPDHAPEPVAPDVLVVIWDAPQPGGSTACCTALGSVVGERLPAMRAAALSCVVRAERPVPVLEASLVGLGEPESARLGDHAERDRRNCSPREQDGIRAEAVGLAVGLDLGDDLRAELEPPVLLSPWGNAGRGTACRRGGTPG
jgi:hypothetical protein